MSKTLTQTITPELRKWIIDQAKAGHTPEAVLKSMMASGWHEDVAVEAMETTLKTHLEEEATAQGLPQGVPVPEPAIGESPTHIDCGDRVVEIAFSMFSPRVVMFNNVLSDEECADLIALADPKMKRSLTVDNKTGGEEMNADRTSDGMFFQRGENELVSRIEARLSKLLNWPVENGEGLQILHYKPGAQYKPHYDYFDPSQPGTPTILKRGGQRVGTIVMYLNSPEKGGGTTFPAPNPCTAARR
jgi:prolyl 4-hydroxylase